MDQIQLAKLVKSKINFTGKKKKNNGKFGPVLYDGQVQRMLRK